MALEVVWLAAVVLVPLVFAPPGSMLSITQLPKVALLRTAVGLMAMLWAVEWALAAGVGPRWPRPGLAPLRRWLAEEPTRWVILLAMVFLGANLLSTLFSASWRVSLWGKTPGGDGYALYTVLCYGLLFLVVATHLKTRRQLWRLVGAVVASGVLVGLVGTLQHYGADVYNLSEELRQSATLGNPIFAGQFLVLTIVVTLAAAMAGPPGWRRRWLAGAWAVALGVQVAALAFTLSRGSWIGLLMALALLGLAVPVLLGRRSVRSVAVVAGPAALVTLVLLLLPGSATVESKPSVTAVTAVTVRAATIPTVIVDTGLGGRLRIWEGSSRLLVGQSWFDFGQDRLSPLRPVLGYGPELFSYVFLLESPSELHLASPKFYDYAHNHYLHEGVELGAVGLLSFLGLLGAVFVLGVRGLRRGGDSHPMTRRWLTLGVLAAMAGWAVAAVVGIPRIGDLTLFWTLLALFVAMPRVFAPGEVEEEAPPPASDRRPRAAWRRRAASVQLPLGRLFIALAAVVLLGTFTWVKSVNYVVASTSAADALDALEVGRTDDSLRLIDRSVGLAPDVALYHLQRAAILQGYAEGTDSAEAGIPYAEQAHESNLRAWRLNPLSGQTTQAVAVSAMELARRGQEARREEAAQLFARLTAAMPHNFRAYELAAHALWLLGDPQRALVEVERSLALTGDDSKGARSHLLRGFFLGELERMEEAAASMERALELGLIGRNDRSEAHRFLARVYGELGDDERAELHLEAYRQLAGE